MSNFGKHEDINLFRESLNQPIFIQHRSDNNIINKTPRIGRNLSKFITPSYTINGSEVHNRDYSLNKIYDRSIS